MKKTKIYKTKKSENTLFIITKDMFTEEYRALNLNTGLLIMKPMKSKKELIKKIELFEIGSFTF